MTGKRGTLGLDFGTHSTKAVYREFEAELGDVLQFDVPSRGYPSSASPSVIRRAGDKLFFGTAAEHHPKGKRLPALKAYLGGRHHPDLSHEEVQVYVAVYLVWSLQQIFSLRPELFHDRLTIQMSAPTAHVGDDELRNVYERIAHAAYRVVFDRAFDATQGISYAAVSQTVQTLLRQPVPPAGERMFRVLPETIAPVVSLNLQPFLATGVYMVVDMGASTTEATVVSVTEMQAEHKLLCYADSTRLAGGLNLAEIQQMRFRESQLELTKFLDELRIQVQRVWHEGYMKDQPNNTARQRWKNLSLLLTGGGTLNRWVVEHFNIVAQPARLMFATDADQIVDRHTPETLQCSVENEDLSLFAVANGLSVPKARWPDFYNQNDVERLDETEVVVDPFAIPYYLQNC